MSAASNSAIKSFIDQRPGDTGASSLSTLVQALHDPVISADLASNAQNAHLLNEVLSRLITIANDGTKATAVRIMCLECLYNVSAGASDAVRQGVLFQHVQQLNQSFDDMMEREEEALSAQREMLVVVLLRCTGYTKLKAGDVLQQLCGGKESVIVSLLVSMLKHPSYEWPLVQAALRWLYELTTPASYFTAETATETTKVHAFQAKVGVLLNYCLSSHALDEVFAQLSGIWRRSSSQSVLGGLARSDTVSSVTVLGSGQQRELLQWAVVLRYLSSLVHNLSEFSDQPKSVRALQESILVSSQDFLVTVAVPFVMAAVQAWERDRASHPANAGSNGGSSGGGHHDVARDPFLNAAIATLRLLRFAFYHSASPSAAAAGGGASQTSPAVSPSKGRLSGPLLTALQYFFQMCSRLEPSLKAEYPGMVVLLLAVQCGCNVNAVTLRGAPVDLASFFEVLVTTIANDKAPIRSDSPYATALAFLICFKREDSPFVETQPEHNESVALVLSRLKHEEAELEEDEKTLEAIVAMQEHLEYLQAIVMQAALGQLLAEIGAVAHRLDEYNNASSSTPHDSDEANPLLLGRRPSTSTPAESPSTRNKKAKKEKHPSKYLCQLTGKLMREPVIIKKTGHHFEYDALMNVVQQMGHVDPITGEDVNEEFDVDEGLRQEIADYRVARAAKK